MTAAAAPALADVDPLPTSPAPTTPGPATAPESTTPADTAPTTPTVDAAPPVSAGTPQISLVGTDDLAPILGLASVRTDLEEARRNGLRVTYRVTEPVTLKADVLIYGEITDRELKMCALPAAGPGDSLAKTTIPWTPTGANVVRIPFNVPSKRTLKKFLKVTVRVRLIATDASGNATTALKTVALKRR